MNEVSKIRDKAFPYLGDKVLDIGCSDCKIVPYAVGVDGRRLPGVDICMDEPYHLSHILPLCSFDSVFSSHCLEHLKYDLQALQDWGKLIKPGGYLILYLPDSNYYNDEGNDEHVRAYNFADFMRFFRRTMCGELKNFRGENEPKIFEVVEAGADVGEDRYSFFVIAKKI